MTHELLDKMSREIAMYERTSSDIHSDDEDTPQAAAVRCYLLVVEAITKEQR
jgi:hypothetical protein